MGGWMHGRVDAWTQEFSTDGQVNHNHNRKGPVSMYEADGKFHRCDNEVVFVSGTVAGLLNILGNLGGCKQKWRKSSCTNLRNS